MSLVLIGLRGSGKSAVARALAARLGWPSVDCDDEIERRSGKSIRELFSLEGQEAFRDLEAKVFAELVGQAMTIVAAGGGLVVRPENRRLLATAEHVVWLQASPQTLAQRIAADDATPGRRPSLTGRAPADELEELLAQREAWYRQAAHLAVDTQSLAPEAIAAQIVERLNLEGNR